VTQMNTDMFSLSQSLSSPFLIHDISWGLQEEFEDSKEVIRIRISKKNRQHNGKKKKY